MTIKKSTLIRMAAKSLDTNKQTPYICHHLAILSVKFPSCDKKLREIKDDVLVHLEGAATYNSFIRELLAKEGVFHYTLSNEHPFVMESRKQLCEFLAKRYEEQND